MAYASITQNMEEKKRAQFDAELVADPDRGPVSHGTKALLSLMGGPIMPRPPSEQIEEEAV